MNDKNESDIDKTKRFDIQEAYESESSVSGFTTERDYVPNEMVNAAIPELVSVKCKEG